jgi:nickel/cobalt exporter
MNHPMEEANVDVNRLACALRKNTAESCRRAGLEFRDRAIVGPIGSGRSNDEACCLDPAEIAPLLPELLPSAVAWLLLAFVLGLVHAFDADHVMALSVFATKRRGVRAGIRAGLRWALGHGIVLLAVGVGLLLLGQSLPTQIAIASERLVGLVMILLGATVWISLIRQGSHLHFHAHDDLRPHAHWHKHEDSGHGHEHGALLVGAAHGLAGSAPILAVLPAAARSPLLGIAYLVLFAFGVAVAMSVVSGLIGHFAGHLSQRPQIRGLAVLRACCASGSIVLGAWLAIAS